MKFLGLFLMFLAFFSLERGFSFSGIGLFFVGLAFLFNDVIFYALKKEIDSKYRRR